MVDVQPEGSTTLRTPGDSTVTTAERLYDVLTRLFGADVPVRVRSWEGTEAGAEGAPLVRVRSRRAVRRLLWRPDDLGLARAYIAGEIDVDGPLVEVLERLAPIGLAIGTGARLDSADRRELLRTAVLLGAVGPQPRPPREEIGGPFPPVDAEIAHAVLGSTYACTAASWAGSDSLDAAQRVAFDLVCDQLGLTEGMHVLDIGSGWGSFLRHAGARGITGRGVCAHPEQAALGRRLLAEAGCGDRIVLEAGDWREVTGGPYDAIVDSDSPGRFAVSGANPTVLPSDTDGVALQRLLRPGGRAVLHIVDRQQEQSPRGFRAAYLGPAGVLPRLGEVVSAVEAGALEVLSVVSVREDLAATTRAWTANLEAHWPTITAHASPGQARTWQVLLAGFAMSLTYGRTGAHRMVIARPSAAGETAAGEAAGGSVTR